MPLLKTAFALVLAIVSTALVPHGTATASTTFSLACDASIAPGETYLGAPAIRKMETSLLAGPTVFGGCWGHLGVQQWFVGNDRVYSLEGGTLNVISTEVELAPTLELGVEADPAHVGVYSPVHVEISMDGLAWSEVSFGQYNIVRVNLDANKVPIPALSGGGNGTYIVESGPLSAGPLAAKDWHTFTFTANGEQFRFLRTHMGKSLLGGLTGYLDYTFGTIQVVDQGPAPALTLTAQTGVAKSCTSDIMEDFFADHPCSYGDPCDLGVLVAPACNVVSLPKHWNSVSNLHTYVLGDALLDRVQGTIRLTPFRPDPVGGGNPNQANGNLFIEASADGANWTTLATIPGVAYNRNVFTFDADNLGGVHAKFLRLHADKHPQFNDFYALAGHPNAELRRFQAVILESSLSLSGQLPS